MQSSAISLKDSVVIVTPKPVTGDNNPATPTAEEQKQGVVGKLYESALPNGSKVQGGTAIATGVIDTQNLQAGQKLQLVVPAENVTSGKAKVTWELNGDKTT